MTNQEEKLKEVMALDFKLYDIQLYLDTHPFDREMLAEFQELSEKAAAARSEYEKMYGPLTADTAATNCEWTWINNPWPWEGTV